MQRQVFYATLMLVFAVLSMVLLVIGAYMNWPEPLVFLGIFVLLVIAFMFLVVAIACSDHVRHRRPKPIIARTRRSSAYGARSVC